LENIDLQQCIDTSLEKFGADATQRLYWRLSVKCDLSADRISSKPSLFVRALYEVFGESGGRSIERAIITEIKQRFRLPLTDCRDLSVAISRANKLLTMPLA
jgi:hypothetical protein